MIIASFSREMVLLHIHKRFAAKTQNTALLEQKHLIVSLWLLILLITQLFCNNT
jgi:hypothetical protein